MNEKKAGHREDVRGELADTRAPYEAPRIMKKRSVARVTLFSGGSTAGITSA